MSSLVVLSVSDSFSTLWPELAEEMEVDLRLVGSVAEAGAVEERCAVIGSVAGAEQEAEKLLEDLAAEGIPNVLVVGANPDRRLVVSLIRAGAADYFALPEDLEELRAGLSDRIRHARETVAAESFARSKRESFDFQRIIGESPQLRAALDRAALIIPRDRATVLITGETGTGKELIAHAIHYNGPRAAAPFVELNCAAIPANLLESELFGYERGAFTDARVAKPGLFETAHGGSLFLDEIGHLPYDLQGKILKALEEKRIRRIGAPGVREVDVRIIAATHVDLEEAVRRGEFREDLYYRLSIIPIHLPPLRQRGADVLLLAEHFLSKLSELYDLSAPVLRPDLRKSLLTHHWPGNVRELRNGLERALLLGEGELRAADLFPRRAGTAAPQSDGALPFPARLEEIERAAARAMLKRSDGNKSAAADALGISRNRFYRLLDLEGVTE